MRTSTLAAVLVSLITFVSAAPIESRDADAIPEASPMFLHRAADLVKKDPYFVSAPPPGGPAAVKKDAYFVSAPPPGSAIVKKDAYFVSAPPPGGVELATEE